MGPKKLHQKVLQKQKLLQLRRASRRKERKKEDTPDVKLSQSTSTKFLNKFTMTLESPRNQWPS